MQSDDKKVKEKKKKTSFFVKCLIFIDVIALICFFFMYGPISVVRDFYVSSALTSWSHRYFAYVFFSPEKVQEIASQNTVIENEEDSDASAIHIAKIEDTGVYESIYEEQILKKDKGNDIYKIIKLDEPTYVAYITAVYDPSRVDLISANNLSWGGQEVQEMAKEHDALVAINGGSAGIYNRALVPRGIYMEDGKVLFDSGYAEKIISFNKDHVLVLSKMTSREAKKAGIMDAVCFGPYLIVNGKPSEFRGDGGYGNRPRTAIGQRQDGIVLFVTVNGKAGFNGTTMKDLTDIFIRYKAYNAANLDGGGSTTLVEKGELVNDPAGWGYSGARHVANAFIVK